jgi:hypothetical protein
VNVSEVRMVEFRTRLAAELRAISLTTTRKIRIKIKPLKEETKPDPVEAKVLAAEEVNVVPKKAMVGDHEVPEMGKEELVETGLVEEEVSGWAKKRRKADVPMDNDALETVSEEWVILESPSGVLSNDSLTFSKTSKPEWKCATRGTIGWDKGVHQWDVRLDQGADGISVGICRAGIDFTDAAKNVNLRYDLFCGEGSVVDIDDQEHSYFAKRAMRKAVVVSVCLDLDQRTLTFGLDGVMKGIPAFSELGMGMWYPYFALRDKGCTFTVHERRNV